MVTASFIVSFSLLMTITTGHDVSLCFEDSGKRLTSSRMLMLFSWQHITLLFGC